MQQGSSDFAALRFQGSGAPLSGKVSCVGLSVQHASQG